MCMSAAAGKHHFILARNMHWHRLICTQTQIHTNANKHLLSTSRHCNAWWRVMPCSLLSLAKCPVQRSSGRHVRMRVDSASRRALGHTTACCAFECVLSECLYCFCCLWIFAYSQTPACALLILWAFDWIGFALPSLHAGVPVIVSWQRAYAIFAPIIIL